jgi:hypothetical protein
LALGLFGPHDGRLMFTVDLLLDLLDDAVVVAGVFEQGELMINHADVDAGDIAQKGQDEFFAHAVLPEKMATGTHDIDRLCNVKIFT